MSSSMLILGAGFSGREIARQALAAGMKVAGTTRSPAAMAGLAALGVTPVQFDGIVDTPELNAAISAATHLVVSIAPDEQGDAVLRTLTDRLTEAPHLRWIGYLSTVGVYGDHDGAWVNEETQVSPSSRRSVQRAGAEAAWEGFAAAKDVPLAILRLSGIYGPGRNTFVNLAEGKARTIIKPGQVFNRIHVEDVAGAALFLAKAETSGIFNVTDDEPAPPQDVVAYAAGLMGIAPPPPVAIEEAGLSPMGLSFYGENKRVANARLKAAGYRLRHPHYRKALKALWDSGSWRGGDSSAPA